VKANVVQQENLIQQEKASSVVLPEIDRWVLFSTILASSMAFIDTSALNVALPALQDDLQASGVQLLWIVNAYLLMLAALILVGGSLGDKLGRKKVFMTGISLFVLASLACGFAPTTEFLIGARVVQGIGGAMMIPGSLAIITASFDPDRRGGAIGTWSAATTIVTVAGPVLGGLLADAGLWRGVFLINLPLGIATLLVLYFKVPESRNEEVSGQIDYLGAVLATLGLVGLTYGFISLPNLGFSDPRIYWTLIGGIVALVACVVVEARSDHPMMPLHLFKSRTFSGTNLVTLFLYGALSVSTFFLSLNLVQAQGYSQSVAGLADTPFALLLTALSGWAGGLADRYGPRLLLIVGPSLIGLGFLLMAFVSLTDGPSDYWTTFLPGIIVFGVGMGVTVAPLTTAVMGSVVTHYAGTASGINNAVSRTAGVLAIAIVGSVALFAFAGAFEARTADIALSNEVRIALQSTAEQLGQVSLPAEVVLENVDAVKMAIKLAFVDTFRVVMIICAGLAWLSALMAALLVESGGVQQ
jgi:EmrB/QacA subfamily drug resistance transporter